MATISRHSAVAQVEASWVARYFAWLAWLVLHLALPGRLSEPHHSPCSPGISFWAAPALVITSQMIYIG